MTTRPHDVGALGRLPAIPATARPACRARATEHEAEQPQDEDGQGDPPQDVYREARATEDEREQENRNNDAHLMSPFKYAVIHPLR
jgi:hypothetical protein